MMNIVGKRALCFRKHCQWLSKQHISRPNLSKLCVPKRSKLHTYAGGNGLARLYAMGLCRLKQEHTQCRMYSDNTSDSQTTLSERDFERICEETLDSLNDMFEDLAETDSTPDDFDVLFAILITNRYLGEVTHNLCVIKICRSKSFQQTRSKSGVITAVMGGGRGTYVINKQSPNKQIWLSSPISGPKRYDYKEGAWIYKHDGVSLHSTLTAEVSSMLGQPLSFMECSYATGRQNGSS